MWTFAPITHEWGWRELLLPQALRGFGQQFALAPVIILSLGSLPPPRLKLASGLFNLMRNLGGAIGIALCGTMLNDRSNVHFLHLAEHLNNSNSGAQALLSNVAAAADAARWNGDTAPWDGSRLTATLDAHFPGSPDAGVRGCLSRDHGVSHRGHRPDTADEKSHSAERPAQGGALRAESRRRYSLFSFAATRLYASRKGMPSDTTSRLASSAA